MEQSHRFIPDAGTRWVTLFVRLVHQLQKLCASSSALRDQLRGHIFFQLTQPDIGFRVARRAPIPARRKRAAGADFRSVGNARALELAEFEKAVKEYFHPTLNFCERVI